MPQLDPTWFASQLFWLFVSFVALYAILAKLILPPLLEVLARREQAKASDLDRAQRMKTQAQQAKEEYERGLAEARSKAQQLFAEAQAENKAQADRAARETDATVAKQLADAGAKIEARKQELLSALTPAAGELAAMIVEKLLNQAPASDKVKMAVGQAKRGG